MRFTCSGNTSILGLSLGFLSGVGGEEVGHGSRQEMPVAPFVVPRGSLALLTSSIGDRSVARVASW